MKRINRNKRKISYKREDRLTEWKIYFSSAIILLLFVSVCYKSVDLQILNRDKAFRIAEKQHTNTYTLLPKRGNILDRNNKNLATNITTQSIYINPRAIDKPEEFATKLSSATNLSYREALSYAVSKRSFIWLKRLADPKFVEGIKKLDLEGIGFIEEPKRVYPNGHLLGQVLGFTNIDSKGIEGIEYMFDGILRGKPNELSFKRDARGKLILTSSVNIEESTAGFDVVLTIDSQIQHIVEKELEEGVKDADAKSGMAVLMRPETGEVLAMATYPFFNPNKFGKYSERSLRNKPVWYTFEPGSTSKVFLVAAALDEKIVNPDTKYNCENGRRKVGPAIIRDTHPHDILTVTQTVTESSNICASKIGENLGKSDLHNYLQKFGFGDETGIDLPGEQSGQLPDESRWGPVELATISFGQGVSVTALQLATAISAIANGGYLMKPYIVKEIVSPRGEVVRENRPAVVRRVISYDTAREVSEIMKQVVEKGTGTNAIIPEYNVAGKTGTAQIPDTKHGGYYKDKYMASFVGFAPVDDPKLTLVVVVQDPKKSIYGGSVAAPIFKSITEKVLFSMGVPAKKEFTGNKIMPDLEGKSAREIFRWADETGVKVEIHGSGYTVKQSPSPGEPIKKGTVCSFTLKQDI